MTHKGVKIMELLKRPIYITVGIRVLLFLSGIVILWMLMSQVAIFLWGVL